MRRCRAEARPRPRAWGAARGMAGQQCTSWAPDPQAPPLAASRRAGLGVAALRPNGALQLAVGATAAAAKQQAAGATAVATAATSGVAGVGVGEAS
mmetsp:Transcript_3506/g.11214  ORF Transcript_3506/g.11214 Transcript_3506/m.11214 type:complete len:96 (-) Transcript_3506:965-1252(-)